MLGKSIHKGKQPRHRQEAVLASGMRAPVLRGSGATLWSPPLHLQGLKIYLANEEIIFKGLALNLEGLCGVCYRLPSTHSLETQPACRERQQTPGVWERTCEPAELASGRRSVCEPLLSYFCPSHPVI